MPEELIVHGPSLLGACLIAFVHVFVRSFRFLDKPNSVWPDFLAGVALGYVFVDILPHLAGKQEMLRTAVDAGGRTNPIERLTGTTSSSVEHTFLRVCGSSSGAVCCCYTGSESKISAHQLVDFCQLKCA